MSALGRNEPCHCGSGLKYKRCHFDQDRVRGAGAGDHGRSTFDSLAGEFTLIVETERGGAARRIPRASALPVNDSQGAAAEEATVDAASTWGLPDFVYRASIDRVGSGTRELGDSLLIVGNVAVVIQVKSRTAVPGDEARERAWVEKSVKRGLRQGAGTVRRLRQSSKTMTSLRGRTDNIDGRLKRWMVLVVIDHPSVPEGCTPDLGLIDVPGIAILRRDWEFLFDQLKSAHAVCGYLERTANEPLALGAEPLRYYDLARADAESEPSKIAPEFLGWGEALSAPMLPLAPAATDDHAAHAMFRTILEDLATVSLAQATEAQRLELLAELDRLPVVRRGTIGRFLLDAFAEATAADGDPNALPLKRVVAEDGRLHLGFGVLGKPVDPNIHTWFSTWVELRHHEIGEITESSGSRPTIGILITPCEGDRRFDTNLVAIWGDRKLTADQVAELRRAWPQPHS